MHKEEYKQNERCGLYTDYTDSQNRSMISHNQIEDRFKISTSSKCLEDDKQASVNIDVSKVSICDNKTEVISDSPNPFLNPDASATMRSKSSDIKKISDLISLPEPAKSQPLFGNLFSIILPANSLVNAQAFIHTPKVESDSKTPLIINKMLEQGYYNLKSLAYPIISQEGGYSTYLEHNKPKFKLPFDSNPSCLFHNTHSTSECKLVTNPLLLTQDTKSPNIKKSDLYTSDLFHTKVEEIKYPYQLQGSQSIDNKSLSKLTVRFNPII